MSSPVHIAIPMIATLVLSPVMGLAAERPESSVVQPRSPSSVITTDTIPMLLSVDLTARTGHMAAASQMTPTKVKRPSLKVLIIVTAVAVGILLLYVYTHVGIDLGDATIAPPGS